MKQRTEPQHIKKRCLFYLSGFDPRGGRHYYSLYKNEAKLRPEGSKSTIEVGVRHADKDNLCWKVIGTANDQCTHTEFKFMAWDKIIRKHWPTGRLRSWLVYAKTSPAYLRSGFFQKAWLLSRPAAGLLFFPNALIILTLLAMVLSTILTFKLASESGLSIWLATAISLAPAWALWRSAHWYEDSRDLGWTMRSYAFTAMQSKGQVPELEKRLNEFAQQLVSQVKKNEDDEILLIGHSSGAIMAISVLARAVALYPGLMGHKAEISLLTLGQCLPMLGLLPDSKVFRSELHTLAHAKDLFWVDISAPLDRCCVAMVNPYSSCGVDSAPEGQGSQFLAVNPLFHELFAAQSYRDLKKNAFQLHFQYLKAPPALGDYDYFEISAGSLSLRERFARRILLPIPQDFDTKTYLRLNPDLVLTNAQAIHHYQQHGAYENRPYRFTLPDDFDPAKYLELNPDVAAAGIAADIHYEQHGKYENRLYKQKHQTHQTH